MIVSCSSDHSTSNKSDYTLEKNSLPDPLKQLGSVLIFEQVLPQVGVEPSIILNCRYRHQRYGFPLHVLYIACYYISFI